MQSLFARHAVIAVDGSALHLEHDDVLAAAGTASGLDACLHVVRTRPGAEAADRVARGLVVAPHRAGGAGAVRRATGRGRRRFDARG